MVRGIDIQARACKCVLVLSPDFPNTRSAAVWCGASWGHLGNFHGSHRVLYNSLGKIVVVVALNYYLGCIVIG